MTLADQSKNTGARLTVVVVAARVRAASTRSTDEFEATRILKAAVKEAQEEGFVGHQFEARLALGEIELHSATPAAGRADLALLERESATLGFNSIARKSAAAFAEDKPLKDSDVIFYGAGATSELPGIKKVIPSLASTGALWIVYPKGRKEITELQVLAAGREAGLVDIKVVSYSPTHTALKFVRPKDKRS